DAAHPTGPPVPGPAGGRVRLGVPAPAAVVAAGRGRRVRGGTDVPDRLRRLLPGPAPDGWGDSGGRPVRPPVGVARTAPPGVAGVGVAARGGRGGAARRRTRPPPHAG